MTCSLSRGASTRDGLNSTANLRSTNQVNNKFLAIFIKPLARNRDPSLNLTEFPSRPRLPPPSDLTPHTIYEISERKMARLVAIPVGLVALISPLLPDWDIEYVKVHILLIISSIMLIIITCLIGPVASTAWAFECMRDSAQILPWD